MATTQDTVSEASWSSWHTEDTPIRLGVSACLLGEKVRYDGGHARSRFVTDVLGEWVEWVPVCPEVEVGMSTPRPTIRLIDTDRGVRLVDPAGGADFTERMLEYSSRKADELHDRKLDGFVFKKSSPSCGMERVRVYRENGIPRKNGRGMFADAFIDRHPLLPTEEEGRLNDAHLRENFIERVFCRNRWRLLVEQGLDRRRLVEFHTAHKLLLRAHDEKGYRALGRITAEFGSTPDQELFDRYEEEFQRTLRHKATARRHTNVLHHAMGYLKKILEPIEKRELLTAIEDFRRGMLPLIVPVTLVHYNVVRHDVDYLLRQLYFAPHPKELMLRNRI